jgi:DNA-binding MarR family transcriptional regulator
MMNEILNLLNLFISRDEQNDQEKQWATRQTNSEQLKSIISKLGTREFRIISLFEINQEVSLKELPKSLGVSQASASRSATKLEDLKVVDKHKTELNNKEWLLSLTESGQELLTIKQKLDDRHKAQLAEISKDYSNEDLEKFANLLRQIIKMDSNQ